MKDILIIIGALLACIGIVFFSALFAGAICGDFNIIANTKKAICYLWGLISAIWHYGED